MPIARPEDNEHQGAIRGIILQFCCILALSMVFHVSGSGHGIGEKSLVAHMH